MKKKIALLIIVVMLLQLLAGCSVGKAQQSASGKKTDKVLKLGVVAKGYGDEYVKQLAIAFEKKTGIKTEVSKSSVSARPSLFPDWEKPSRCRQSRPSDRPDGHIPLHGGNLSSDYWRTAKQSGVRC